MTLPSTRFKAWRVEEQQVDGKTRYVGRVMERQVSELPPGEVLLRVRYSSLNYKDALSASGNRGVTRQYPHTPGIDAAGEVLHSDVPEITPGSHVIVTGYDLGMNTDGGFAQRIRVPAQWLVPLPEGLSLFDSMALGTAGLTAALCVRKLLQNGLRPDDGDVLVTGASGGVGSVAVALLARLGFSVHACTGKSAAQEFLHTLGARSVLPRTALDAPADRPLLKERWAGAVDVVGGDVLASVLRSTRAGGSVACCGLVGSPDLPVTVFPFILRGINLLGVDSVNIARAEKQALWHALAGEWRLPVLPHIAHEIGFEQLQQGLDDLLAGKSTGRTVLRL
ncbi:MAG: YhdH/YhfP family quinone oxidoreductase [Pseudomonadales bacterium]|nr:YhdH/YhfP family quinone oxidoreductase [Pseudomonadales bacterium]MCP5331575.1 YhdH/YhfP family quinone oxidoreductase [Pseudomonadales bacterium]MCP5343458.1 YhdH/YhfP family quinone oxidoreductase [Pseudomonadales bacterium]